MCVCVWVCMDVGACGSQMRALDPLAVKLKAAVGARN